MSHSKGEFQTIQGTRMIIGVDYASPQKDESSRDVNNDYHKRSVWNPTREEFQRYKSRELELANLEIERSKTPLKRSCCLFSEQTIALTSRK